MAAVRVRSGYQLTLPTSIRRKAALSVGDVLEAKVLGRKITLVPKSAIDRELDLAFEEVEQGKVHGPFSTVDELLQALHKKPKSLKRR